MGRTFYDEASEVLLHLFASPLDNHDLLRLRETCNRLGLPPNDLHGAAFFETKELVGIPIQFTILSFSSDLPTENCVTLCLRFSVQRGSTSSCTYI